jgi:hypothetical protein
VKPNSEEDRVLGQFEFFMTLYGLLLGLAVAELFGGLARIIQERTRPRIGIMAPLLGVILLIELVATFIDAWRNLRSVSIELTELAIPTTVALTYFALAAILVPRDFQEWPNLDGYFDHRRRWIIGLFLTANPLIMGVDFVANDIAESSSLDMLGWVARQVWLLGSYVVMLLSRKRWLDIAAAISVIVFYVFLYVARPQIWGWG